MHYVSLAFVLVNDLITFPFAKVRIFFQSKGTGTFIQPCAGVRSREVSGSYGGNMGVKHSCPYNFRIAYPCPTDSCYCMIFWQIH